MTPSPRKASRCTFFRQAAGADITGCGPLTAWRAAADEGPVSTAAGIRAKGSGARAGKFRMPLKFNPLKLNSLQLRTLTLLQVLARDPRSAGTGPGPGEMTVERFPPAHGAHLHVGDRVVAAKDATGLFNDKVWHALERKGLARSDWPHRITLTPPGLAYATGIGAELFHASPH